jgi:hypothetical protein
MLWLPGRVGIALIFRVYVNPRVAERTACFVENRISLKEFHSIVLGLLLLAFEGSQDNLRNIGLETDLRLAPQVEHLVQLFMRLNIWLNVEDLDTLNWVVDDCRGAAKLPRPDLEITWVLDR